MNGCLNWLAVLTIATALTQQGCSAAQDNPTAPITPTTLAFTAAPSASTQDRVALPVQPVVQLQDANGTAVALAGTVITVSITTGGGTLNGTTTATTTSNGTATFTNLSIAGTVGARTLTFAATGLAAATAPVSLTAGAATAIAVNAGNNQSATAGAAVAITPGVSLTDADANGVSGVAVTFAVASGGGSIAGASETTNAAGLATVGSWTLGTTVGTNTLTTSATGLTAVTFTATGTAGTAATMGVNAGNNQSAAGGTASATAPSVKVTDANGNPVSGVAVTFAVASGGGSIAGASQTTSASGTATVGSWTLGLAPGPNTLTATSTGLTAVTFTATGTVTLSVVPAIAAAAPNATVAFAGQDQAGGAQAVTWRVNGITGGTAQCGLVSGAGQYSAPPTLPAGDSVVVSAVLVADTTRQRSATVFFVPDLTTKDYYVPIPRVVDATRPGPTRFLVVPPASATTVNFVPITGAAVPLTAIGSGVLSFQVDAASAIAGYQSGTLHNFIGRLDYRNAAGTSLSLRNLLVNVRDATMPDVVVTSLAPDAQRSAYVLNLRVDTVTTSPYSAIVSRALQSLGGDQFDFVALIATVTTFNNRFFQSVRNDVSGIGLTLYDMSQVWGGTGKLRGAINFPIDGFFDGAEQGMMHETGHAWINYATDPVLATGRPHWPASTMALGTMGVSLTGGEGGQFPWSLTPIGSGNVRINRATASDRFTPLDLYVMGLLPPDSVPTMYVLPSNADPNTFVDGMTSPATTYTISNYVASQGARSPASTTAPHSFTAAVVVLTYGRLMTPSEMAFFDAAAARGETTVSLKSAAGLVTVDASGFFLATGGRATLRTRLP